jgi:hypothetical protein
MERKTVGGSPDWMDEQEMYGRVFVSPEMTTGDDTKLNGGRLEIQQTRLNP